MWPATFKPRRDGFAATLASSASKSSTPWFSPVLGHSRPPALLQVCYISLMCQCSPVRPQRSLFFFFLFGLHHRATATGVGVKAVGSWPMLCSLISVVLFSVCTVGGTTEEDVLCIHEWLMMSSKDGRSAGRRDRHHLISCWHSEIRRRTTQ